MKRWKKNEFYRKQARKAGFRSRAAFKLLEIDKRFEILKHANRIIDICSAPGSWLQVIKERCDDPDSVIIGIDIAHLKPIPGVHIIRSSIEAPELDTRLTELLKKPAQVILSDCSPKLSGSKSLDRERQLWLAQLSFNLVKRFLAKKGHFVTKVFQSNEFRNFIIETKKHFLSVKTYKPQSSFKRSPEMYLIAKGFKGVAEPASQDDP
ncbi:MAG: RlmE family RNA methyltransferase [Candidatus Hermodarchaeia archaeon]|jgi:23S rRNA (uridine2552-2'-O)-methyltransferase